MSAVQGKHSIPSDEFKFRLQHLVNILQIVTTNSSSTNYNDQNWAIAREYSNHVFKDLEEGIKTWKSMGLSIQTDAYIFSKDAIKIKDVI